MASIFSQKDYQLFEHICQFSEKGLYSGMLKFLERAGYKEIITKRNYIVAIGSIPVGLVAHMDTVFPRPAKNIYYDRVKNVLWSSEGLGADDRAGVFSVMKIIQKGYKPTIIFTLGEESGGIGAYDLVEDSPFAPAKMKYLIELDRQGEDDCVFYKCNNASFKEYVKGFGFNLEIGTFTDISILCPNWKICGVNLSIGYEDEHTYSEILHVDWMYRTIKNVCNMLDAIESAPIFEWVGGGNPYGEFNWKAAYGYNDCLCGYCHKELSDYDLYAVMTPDKHYKEFCIDCLTRYCMWCPECGEPYIDDQDRSGLCYKCREDSIND